MHNNSMTGDSNWLPASGMASFLSVGGRHASAHDCHVTVPHNRVSVIELVASDVFAIKFGASLSVLNGEDWHTQIK